MGSFIFLLYPLGKSILIVLGHYKHTVDGFMQNGAINVASELLTKLSFATFV